MSFETIQQTNPSERILQITLNRPRQFNALNRQMMMELQNALEEFANHQDFQILILTGAGRAFCFGADFAEFQDRSTLPDLLHIFQSLILNLYHCPKVSIACLNGFATGAGLDLALACDFRIAAEKTKIGEAYISMGLVSDGGGSFLLPRLIGQSRAMEIFLTGEAISAEEGLSIGMLHRVFPQADLIPRSIEFANRLLSKPATARKHLKHLLKNPATTLQEALKKERELQLICFEDSEHLELVAKAQRRKEK